MSYYAAIDCGTNTFRLLIVNDGTGQAVDVARAKNEVGLGEGFTKEKKIISPEKLQDAEEALQNFMEEIEQYNIRPENISVTGTSAPREAENSFAFKTLVQKKTGVELELLDGPKEAELGFRGASRAVEEKAPTAQRWMTVDIGGGSTEFCIGGHGGLETRVSTEIGSSWITERFNALAREKLPNIDPVGNQQAVLTKYPEILDALRKEADTEISAQLKKTNCELDSIDIDTLVGVGGSAETLATVVNEKQFGKEPTEMPTEGISELADELYKATLSERLEMGVDSKKRATKIPGGALILGVVLGKFGETLPNKIIVSPYDVRDGRIKELQGQGSVVPSQKTVSPGGLSPTGRSFPASPANPRARPNGLNGPRI